MSTRLERLLRPRSIAVVGAGAQYCRVRAVSVAEMTAIAPLDYTRLIFAVVAGVIIFGE